MSRLSGLRYCGLLAGDRLVLALFFVVTMLAGELGQEADHALRSVRPEWRRCLARKAPHQMSGIPLPDIGCPRGVHDRLTLQQSTSSKQLLVTLHINFARRKPRTPVKLLHRKC
jgi:hypothetical protein